MASNLHRTVSFCRLQEKDSLSRVYDKPTPIPFPPSRLSKSYPQLAPRSNRHTQSLPQPSNPVLRSGSDTPFNDVIPAVPAKETSGFSSMKAGQFLANKCKATLRNAASTRTVKMLSVDLNKTARMAYTLNLRSNHCRRRGMLDLLYEIQLGLYVSIWR